MGFSIIVAADKNRGIGCKNDLPWRLKGDMQWFKQITISKNPDHPNCMIMGRKTWESIPQKFRPLPERINIVVTHHPETVSAPYTVGGFEEALVLAKTFGSEIFIIGGASIYQEAFLHQELEFLYITEIEHVFPCDTFFPEYHHVQLLEELAHGEENGVSYHIRKYQMQVNPGRS